MLCKWPLETPLLPHRGLHPTEKKPLWYDSHYALDNSILTLPLAFGFAEAALLILKPNAKSITAPFPQCCASYVHVLDVVLFQAWLIYWFCLILSSIEVTSVPSTHLSTSLYLFVLIIVPMTSSFVCLSVTKQENNFKSNHKSHAYRGRFWKNPKVLFIPKDYFVQL